jgi:phosphatidylserine decarboxylase
MAALLALAAFLALFGAWRFWFFLRDPERTPPSGASLLAPADGWVVYAKRVVAGEVPVLVKGRRAMPLDEFTGVPGVAGADGVLVGIFVTAFSVHRNRVPVSGEVVFRHHRRARRNLSMAGLFANLLLGRAPYDANGRCLLENERLTIGIRTPSGTVTVTQIADAWIRRIVAEVTVGQRVVRGDRYGLIRFGSQVDVFVPDSLGLEVRVRPGQRLRAGESVVAAERGAP